MLMALLGLWLSFLSYLESDLDDLNRDIQSPEPELLYYRGPEDQESIEHLVDGNTAEMTALPLDVSGAQNWYKMLSNMTQSHLNKCQFAITATSS